jgi:hypothetical protein
VLRRAADWLVPSSNPAGAIYGVIVIGALLAAESARHESYLDTLASALLAATLYWFAHAYAGVLGRRLTHHERLSSSALARALAHDWALVRGAGVPLVALAIAWALGATQEDAVTTALWSAIGSLVGLELLAGVRSHATLGELAVDAVVGLAMGTAILVLKIILH